METLFDSPRWAWRLDLTGFVDILLGHELACGIERDGEVLKTVKLMPPADLYTFVESQGFDLGTASWFRIELHGKRAYMTLCAEGENKHGRYVLFYWTASTAPAWLRDYL